MTTSTPGETLEDAEAAEAAQLRTKALRGAGWAGPIDAGGWAVTDPPSGVDRYGQPLIYPRELVETLDWIAQDAFGDGPGDCCRCGPDDDLANCRCVVGGGAPRDRCVCGPWDLAAAIAADDAAEDAGDIDGDARSTCHRCQSWADHAHHPADNSRISIGAYRLRQLQDRLRLPRPASSRR
jgi:hypothetical protein